MTSEKIAALLRQLDPSLAGDRPRILAEKFLTGQNTPYACADGMRWQDKIIEGVIADSASVLDLGCGGGQLLDRLIRRKAVRGQGIELDPDAVFECIERGVPVFQSDLDAGLKGFNDDSFDYVVLEETIQALRRPAELLHDLLRVGRTGIVSFPNFGHWRVRLDLTLQGRMPVTPTLPYQWFDTPNIHLLTLKDFMAWTLEAKVRIVAGHALCEGAVRPLADHDELYAEEVLMVIAKL